MGQILNCDENQDLLLLFRQFIQGAQGLAKLHPILLFGREGVNIHAYPTRDCGAGLCLFVPPLAYEQIMHNREQPRLEG